MIVEIESLIDLSILVFGVLLNILLLFLISRYSKPHLGNYRYLLIVFASNDICMLVVHLIVRPASISSGCALGAFSKEFPKNKYIISISGSYFTVPFTLMNINFLHRFWSVRSPFKLEWFSNAKFVSKLALYPIFFAFLWFVGCLATSGNAAGKAILQQFVSALHGISVDDGWLVLHFWDDDHLNIRGCAILLLAASIIISNFVVAGILFTLTLFHLKSENMLSSSYKTFQIKILRALFAQSVIPILFVYIPFGTAVSIPIFGNVPDAGRLDRWFTVISIFPALDAVVIMMMMKDYREGLFAIIWGRNLIEPIKSNWNTTQITGKT